MPRKKYVKGILIALLAIIVYDNLPSLPINYYQTVSSHYGSNSDITNGALSRLHDMIYVVEWENGDQQTFGSGTDSVLLKQRGTFHFGVSSYIPFYKKMYPKLVFDCFIATGNKYIGKIEIEKQVTMTGVYNRGTMKRVFKENYTNEAIQLLNNKALSYEEATGLNPVIKQSEPEGTIYASYSSGVGLTTSRINVTLADYILSFNRTIPIRQRGQVYSDTIFFKPHVSDPEYPLYEIYEVNKPSKLLTYTSYNAAGKVIYSKKFTLEAVDEDHAKFFSSSYTVYNQ